MRVRPGIELSALSDVGCARPNNEDRYAYWEPEGEDEFQRKGRLALVADGMGGMEGGQEASRIAAESLEQVFREADESEPQALLLKGFQTAHDRVLNYAAAHAELAGMGTTCTAIVLRGNELHYAHVGDSRLYLAQDSALRCLTHDQTYVARLVEQGVISPAEALLHPHRNVLIMAMGVGPELVPQVSSQPLSVKTGDALLLCTDGLWGMVSEDELLAALQAKSLDEACRGLLATAKQRGAPDNLTVQAIRLV